MTRIDYVSVYGQLLMGLDRPMDWDETGMMQALAIAQRSKCARAKNGCAIVRDNRVVSHGYNGALSGQDVCCTTDTSPCDRAVHAETNAVFWAARVGTPLAGCTAYTTTSPCRLCARALVQVGVIRVVYLKEYRDPSGLDVLSEARVDFSQLSIAKELANAV